MQLRVGLFVALIGLATSVMASELDFTYASRLPVPQGEVRSAVQGGDRAGELRVTKTVFVLEHASGSVQTHVAAASCGEAGLPALPYMVALQYLPKTFDSFAQATLLDGFSEVYVTDETERVRLYRNVPGYVMAELTERFMPSCLGI